VGGVLDKFCPPTRGFILACVLHTSMVKHIRLTMNDERFKELKEFKKQNGYEWQDVLEHGTVNNDS